MDAFSNLIQIWGNISACNPNHKVSSIENYRELVFDYFHVGPYYYYIFDVPQLKFEFISENIINILGYDSKSISVPELIEKIHPEDISFFIECENAIVDFSKTISPQKFINYKFSYNYRMQKVDGTYVRILQQVMTIDMDLETGELIKTLGIHTDISHIINPQSKDHDSQISFIGLNGEPSFSKTKSEVLGKANNLLQQLTSRQRQIVSCLMAGMTSKEIAENLFISKHTVDTHRKNILELLEVSNTHQLILKVSKNGWV